MSDPPCSLGICDGSGIVVDEAAGEARSCACRPQLIARARARSLSAVIPRRFQGVGFARAPVIDINPQIVREVRRYVDKLQTNLDSGRGLWFMGDVGTGKTTLAMLVSKAALDAGRSVAIYSLPRLLAEIRTTFDDSSDRSYLSLLDKLSSVDLLHIDDVGAEKSSDWFLEQLYSLVNARYEDERSIVLTTNLDPAELAKQITTRTVSRLMEICGDPLPLFGVDHRQPGVNEPLPSAPPSEPSHPLA